MIRGLLPLIRPLAGVLSAGLSQLAINLADGTVPFPGDLKWSIQTLTAIMLFLVVMLAQAATERACRERHAEREAILRARIEDLEQLAEYGTKQARGAARRIRAQAKAPVGDD